MAKPTNSGVIVALLPSREYTDVRPTIADHHLTVAFLGRYDDPSINDKAVKGFWADLEKLWSFKIQAEVTAESVFSTPDGWAHVDLVNAPFLPDFRSITQELLDLHGLPLRRDFGLLPHMTKRYVQSANPIEVVHRKMNLHFTFNRVGLWLGDERLERDLG